MQEFYRKCFLAYESLTNQIDWAQVEAGQSRERIVMAQSMYQGDSDDSHEITPEERALATLFEAHSALGEALKQHDDMERMAVDDREMREVRERSKKETRMDRSVSLRRHNQSYYFGRRR
jgi:chorismate-pyruvate lyase